LRKNLTAWIVARGAEGAVQTGRVAQALSEPRAQGMGSTVSGFVPYALECALDAYTTQTETFAENLLRNRSRARQQKARRARMRANVSGLM